MFLVFYHFIFHYLNDCFENLDLSTKIIRTPAYNEFLAAHSKSGVRRADGHTVSHKPEGQQYDDFETIDWVKDIACDRDRHRRIHSDKVTNMVKKLVFGIQRIDNNNLFYPYRIHFSENFGFIGILLLDGYV